MSDYFLFYGFGSAQSLGSATADAPKETSARRLRSTSRAFCEALERGGAIAAEQSQEPMGFAIPKVQK